MSAGGEKEADLSIQGHTHFHDTTARCRRHHQTNPRCGLFVGTRTCLHPGCPSSPVLEYLGAGDLCCNRERSWRAGEFLSSKSSSQFSGWATACLRGVEGLGSAHSCSRTVGSWPPNKVVVPAF